MIRVLICDDQVVVTEGLEMILSVDPEIEVVGLAYGGAEVIQKAEELHPDLILMDLNMPGINGIQATREIHKVHPEIKILVLTTFGDDEWIFDAIRSGALGYLLKGTPREELIRAVKGTVAGDAYIDPAVGSKLLAHITSQPVPQSTTIASDLSEREMEILRLLARGLTNAEIAEKLFLTKGTVRNYVSSVLAKLEVEDRTQAAILAIRYGLVQSE
ncbi:MAG: response regulator transcription factor [Chloroflexi bacterium]|jgi:two-component system, NarL family, response regulator LiaR|nr:response regulator transcription factor [Chloroflexota bacterium]